MKHPLLCLALLLLTSLCTGVRAQKTARLTNPGTDTWGRAVFRGAADNFAVTPGEEVWRATATGDLWHADSWSYTRFGEDDFDGEHFEQTNNPSKRASGSTRPPPCPTATPGWRILTR